MSLACDHLTRVPERMGWWRGPSGLVALARADGQFCLDVTARNYLDCVRCRVLRESSKLSNIGHSCAACRGHERAMAGIVKTQDGPISGAGEAKALPTVRASNCYG